MATSVAAIAAEAFTAAAAELPDAIHSGWLVRSSPAGYEPESGKVKSLEKRERCRALLASADAASDIFPDLEISAPDEIVYVEGLKTMDAREGDVLQLDGGVRWTLRTGRNLMKAGGLWAAIVRAN